MQNPMAFEVHYNDYQRQSAWINENDWQFEKTEKRYRMRATVAKALLHLAALLAPPTREAGTA